MTILPIPIDLVSPFIEMMKRNNTRADAENKAAAEAKVVAAATQPAPLPPAAPPPAFRRRKIRPVCSIRSRSRSTSRDSSDSAQFIARDCRL